MFCLSKTNEHSKKFSNGYVCDWTLSQQKYFSNQNGQVSFKVAKV